MKAVAASRRAALWMPALPVLVLLAALDIWVRGPFFSRHIRRTYEPPQAVLRERTIGLNPSIFFDLLRDRPPGATTVVLLGDSTVVGNIDIMPGPSAETDPESLAWALRAALRQQPDGANVWLADAAVIGLYGREAALFANKAIRAGADVLVYGITPRVFPTTSPPEFVSCVRQHQSPAELLQLIEAGGWSWLTSTLSLDEVVGGCVHSGWATYRYRLELRRLVLGELVRHGGWRWPGFVAWAIEKGVPPRLGTAPPRATRAYDWLARDYTIPNANWDGFEMFARLCHRFLPGRCIVYASPINPEGRDRLAEPGLYDGYLTRARQVAQEYGLEWRDYTDVMQATDYRAPKVASRDAIHLNPGGMSKLAARLLEPLRLVLARVGQ